MIVGFSTGAIAKGNFSLALTALRQKAIEAVELSALREVEVGPLMDAVPDLDLSTFRYVSVHAPSKLGALTDRDVVRVLRPAIDRKWSIVIHPDAVTDFGAWRELGHLVLVENTDGRKAVGRYANELSQTFALLPDARLCLDVGHARQIDPTMTEAHRILVAFGDRLAQLHVSEVDAGCRHRAIGGGASLAYRSLFQGRPVDVPVILESPVLSGDVDAEVEFARTMLDPLRQHAAA
jgi:hypothetical protein